MQFERRTEAEQIGDELPQVAIVESVDQVLEQGEGEEQSISAKIRIDCCGW